MDYTDFTKLAQKMGAHNLFYPYNKDKKDDLLCFSIDWTTGGTTGRSCWGSDNVRAVEADKEPELEALDEFLLAIYPEMPFLFYKKNVLALVKTADTYDNDYYGNVYEKRCKYVLLEDLFKKLSTNLEIKGLEEITQGMNYQKKKMKIL